MTVIPNCENTETGKHSYDKLSVVQKGLMTMNQNGICNRRHITFLLPWFPVAVVMATVLALSSNVLACPTCTPTGYYEPCSFMAMVLDLKHKKDDTTVRYTKADTGPLCRKLPVDPPDPPHPILGGSGTEQCPYYYDHMQIKWMDLIICFAHDTGKKYKPEKYKEIGFPEGARLTCTLSAGGVVDDWVLYLPNGYKIKMNSPVKIYGPGGELVRTYSGSSIIIGGGRRGNMGASSRRER